MINEEMLKIEKCNQCIHNGICEQLEEYRDPLGFISTKDEFVCSHFTALSDYAKLIFNEIDIALNFYKKYNPYNELLKSVIRKIAEIKKKYTEGAPTE